MQLFLIAIACIFTTITDADYTQCGYQDIDGDIFDLSPLIDANRSYYTLTDPTDADTTFFIHFCSNITTLPPATSCGATSSSVCIQESANGTTCELFANRTAGSLTHAYVEYPNDRCDATAGGDREDFVNVSKLIEYSTITTLAGKRLVVTYNYGDSCINVAGSAVNRQLVINMVCDENITDIEAGSSFVNTGAGPNGCISEVQIDSIYGCPVNETAIVNATEIPMLNTTEAPMVNLSTTDLLLPNTTESTFVTDISTTEDMSTTDIELTESTFDFETTELESTELESTSVESTEVTDSANTTALLSSISGRWTDFDVITNEQFSVTIEISTDCNEITFTMLAPANNRWFAFGVGGYYEHASSEEVEASSGEASDGTSQSEADVMNGYAIVATGIGANDVYETTLESGMAPEPQTNNDIDCEGVEENGIRYIECKRGYDTLDPVDEDFNEFIAGYNPMIYAYGMIDEGGNLLQHGMNGYGEAHETFIYMEEVGELCGYAKEYADAQQGATTPSKDEEMWMIIGIVFIVAFAIMLGVVIYLCWKLKESDSDSYPRHRGGYQATAHTDDY